MDRSGQSLQYSPAQGAALPSVARGAALWTAYVAAYVLLDWMSFVQPVLHLGITPWSPQAGLTLAFLIAFGPRLAPLTAVAALLSEVLIRATPASWLVLVCVSVAIAASYYLAARALVARDVKPPIETLSAVVWLIVASTVAACAVSVVYVLSFAAAHRLPVEAIGGSIIRYWVGDLNGVLTLTPLLLAVPRWRAGIEKLAQRPWEAAAQVAVLVGAVWLIFGLRATNDLRFFYPLFVPVVWIAFRWGVPGTALCTLAIQMTLIVAARGEAEYEPLLDLQFLMITLGATGLLLGSVVTERLAGEARLRERDRALAKAMRFAAVGEFASGMAHELNQPITAQVSYLRAAQILAEPFAGRDPRLAETLDKAAREALRTSDILRRLRDFSRGGAPQIGIVNIEEVAAGVLQSHEQRARARGVRLRSQFAADLPSVASDRTQIEMALHNLLSNAVDAVSQSRAAVPGILVSASRSGDSVLLIVEDSGPGVSPEVAERIFEPFVTTKPDGMGLGLSISRSLLRSHGGDLWQEQSELGGARFVMSIPLVAREPAAP
jgi:signal transduction histidine kinase